MRRRRPSSRGEDGDGERSARGRRAAPRPAPRRRTANGKRNSRFARGWSGESQRTTVGQQVRRALPLHDPRAGPVAGGHVLGPRHLEVPVDHRGDAPRDVRVREGRELGQGVVLRARDDGGEPRGQGLGDLAAARGRPHAGGVDARAAAVLGDGRGHHVEVLRATRRAMSGPEQHLAVAGAVHLDPGVGVPGAGRGHVAEDHPPPAAAEDLAGPRVVRGVEAEGLGRRARGHEGLDEPVGRPRLGGARLEDERRLERDRGDPERVHAGRVARAGRRPGWASGARSSPRGPPPRRARGRARRGRGRG